MKPDGPSKLLRLALRANATFSLVSGILIFLFPGGVSDLLGQDAPLVYRGVGLGLLLFAAAIAVILRRREDAPFFALWICFGDLIWVFGTALLFIAAGHWFSLQGILAMGTVAVVVLAFALAQLEGIRRSFLLGSGDNDTYYLEVSFTSKLDAEDIWPVIRDLGGIHKYSDDVLSSHIRDDHPIQVGATRECANSTGDVWAEECVHLDDDRRELELRFLHEEPAFPFPVEQLRGGWRVGEKDSGSIVTVWWIAHLSKRWLAPLLFPIMHRRLRKSMSTVVRNMGREALV